MPMDNEVETLVSLVASAIVRSATTSATGKSVGADYPEAMKAGADAAETLAALCLSDIRRIADALEVLAKLKLAEEQKTSLFDQSGKDK